MGKTIKSNKCLEDDQNTTYGVATSATNGLMSKEDKVKLDNLNDIDPSEFENTTYHLSKTGSTIKLTGSDGSVTSVEDSDTPYIHPSYTPRTSGFYKITVDSTGHVSEITPVTKADITGLGIPGQDTTYSNATSVSAGLMSSSDKTRLDNLAINADNTTYRLTKSGETITLTGSDGTTTSVTDANTTYSNATTSTAGLMSSTDKTKLNGIATGAQVNSITGVKGSAENSYRTGNVNLTPANIGALPISGGTLTGLTYTQNLRPSSNNTYYLGSPSAYWKRVYTKGIYFDDNNGFRFGWVNNKVAVYVDDQLIGYMAFQ